MDNHHKLTNTYTDDPVGVFLQETYKLPMLLNIWASLTALLAILQRWPRNKQYDFIFCLFFLSIFTNQLGTLFGFTRLINYDKYNVWRFVDHCKNS